MNDINDIINSKKIINNIGKTKSNSKNKDKNLITSKSLKIDNANPPKKSNFYEINNLNISKNLKDNSNSKIGINNNKILNLISKENKRKNKNKKGNKNKFSKYKNSKIKQDIVNKTIHNLNINNIKNNIKFNNFELNTMDYENALIYDKRTCFEYYLVLLRIKHPLLFGFCPIKDYNTMIIKLCIFLLSFDIYYVINFSFFNEDVIHKLYEDGGGFDVVYFIPQISISFAVSHIITVLIKFIFLSESNIIEVRKQKTYTAAIHISTKVKKNIICKYVIFYISGIIFLFFFWMLLSSFGAVYQNTQVILFESVLISFGISFVFPIFYNIIPCILRTCSLNNKEKNSDCIYKTSKFLQIL